MSHVSVYQEASGSAPEGEEWVLEVEQSGWKSGDNVQGEIEGWSSSNQQTNQQTSEAIFPCSFTFYAILVIILPKIF